jgi:hypothetical protein
LAAGRSKFSRFQVITENMLAPSPAAEWRLLKRCIYPKPI